MRYLLCFFVLISGLFFYGMTIRYYVRELKMEPDRKDMVFLGGAFFACSTICFVDTGFLPFAFIFLLLLAMITWIDFKKKIIPNRLNAAILLLGLVRQAAALIFGSGVMNLLPSTADSTLAETLSEALPGALSGAPDLKECLAGLLVISIPVILINRVFPGGLGGGDVKLLACAGFYLGRKGVVRGAAAGSLLAAAVCLVLIFTRRLTLKDKVAFGPYLCAGMAAAALLGG